MASSSPKPTTPRTEPWRADSTAPTITAPSRTKKTSSISNPGTVDFSRSRIMVPPPDFTMIS